jgi:hypothetical protein
MLPILPDRRWMILIMMPVMMDITPDVCCVSVVLVVVCRWLLRFIGICTMVRVPSIGGSMMIGIILLIIIIIVDGMVRTTAGVGIWAGGGASVGAGTLAGDLAGLGVVIIITLPMVLHGVMAVGAVTRGVA